MHLRILSKHWSDWTTDLVRKERKTERSWHLLFKLFVSRLRPMLIFLFLYNFLKILSSIILSYFKLLVLRKEQLQKKKKRLKVSMNSNYLWLSSRNWKANLLSNELYLQREKRQQDHYWIQQHWVTLKLKKKIEHACTIFHIG